MIVALPFIGILIGAAVNWCIYRLGDEKWPLRSRSAPDLASGAGGRTAWFPLVGWLLQSPDSLMNSHRPWFRPMAMELTWAASLPLFFYWISNHGLTAGAVPPPAWTTIWFTGFSLMFAFLCVATFIDFDQRIIPDSVTIPGTLIALFLAAVWPSFRLPEVVFNLAGEAVDSVDFADAQPLPAWHRGGYGLTVGLTILAIWILALLPKFPLMELNIRSLRFVIASTIRFLRKNNLTVRRRSRRTGLLYLAIGALAMLAVAIAWWILSPQQLDSLFGALVGLGFGGLMVWLVRIVASHSLGREAMGFGDVTLMAMIGAFLGWQASLIVFALSPFAALAIVLVSYIITRESELAFGPYLCFSAVITVIGWSEIWPWARQSFFLMPGLLMTALGASLFLLMLMMLAVRFVKATAVTESNEGKSDA